MQYTYQDGVNGTTSDRVSSLATAQGTYAYTYDVNGNILSVSKNGTLLESYTYDTLGQLKTVTRGTDVYEYTYDLGGNILSIKLNGTVTDTYTYGDTQWKDKMTAYNGQTITYDAIGNPLTYRDGKSFSWKYGRTMEYYYDSAHSIFYRQNADGIRVAKHITDKSTGVTEAHYYDYNGSDLVAERWGDNVLWFLRDESGSPIGFTYNGTAYYYLKNLQGDITGIADASGTIVTEYEYDAWGKVLSVSGSMASTVGQINPLRYRGYYYDTETGLYYVTTRYYDPEVGRWINADGVIDTRGTITQNAFQYCGNNPVNNADPSGNLFGSIIGVGLLVLGMVAILSGCGSTAATPSSTVSTSSGTTTSSSSTSSMSSLTLEQKHFVSVIAGEAIGANVKTQKAVAHTIMNRVNEPRDVWRYATSVSEVLVSAQYNAVDSPQYKKCMSYLDNRDGNNSEYEDLIAAVIPIYLGDEADFTGGAHYIFNVNGSAGLLRALEAQPERYVKCGPFSDISDIEYRMYRCMW